MFQPIGRELTQGHRVVSASMLPEQIIQCPHCGSKNFTMTGSFHRAFEQIFEESKAKEGGLTLAQAASQEVEGIVCIECNIHTIVEDPDIFDRESLIFDLHTQIATLQGKVVLAPSGKEWIQ